MKTQPKVKIPRKSTIFLLFVAATAVWLLIMAGIGFLLAPGFDLPADTIMLIFILAAIVIEVITIWCLYRYLKSLDHIYDPDIGR